MSVLPAGERLSNPLEILQASSARSLIEALRERFDRIVIDTPPVVPFSDAAILGAEADGAVLVVRASRTARATVERARHALEGSRMLGAVLNDAKPTPVRTSQEVAEDILAARTIDQLRPLGREVMALPEAERAEVQALGKSGQAKLLEAEK